MKMPTADSASIHPYPAITAIAFIIAVAASLWLGARQEPPAPASIVESSQPAPANPSVPTPLPGAVTAYLAFAEEPSPAELPLDHGYTAEGIQKLAAAIAVKGDTRLWRDRQRRLRAAAEELGSNPNSLRHADIARDAFALAAEWLIDLQSRYASGSHLEAIARELRSAAEAIQRDQPLRTQKQAVDSFFDKAAAAMVPAGERPKT